MKLIAIYRVINKVNGKSYIGSSIDVEKRFGHHFCLLRKEIHGNIYLQNAYSKYGEKNFKFVILEFFSDDISNDKLIKAEQYYMKKYDSFIPNGYNLVLADRTEMSEETRKKISKNNRGKKRSFEVRKNMSEAQRGKKHSFEARKKKSKIMKIYFKEHPEAGEKMSKFQIKRFKNPVERRKQSEFTKGRYKKLGESEKMSKAIKEGWRKKKEKEKFKVA